MRILITGGCGFIGSHLVEYHLAKNDIVYVIDNLSTGSVKNVEHFKQNANFNLIIGDIRERETLKKLIGNVDLVYHLAAVVGIYQVIKNPLDVLSTNIRGTEILFDLIAERSHPPRVVIASSSSVYGNCEESKLKENGKLCIHCPEHPLCGYAASKIANEVYALAYYHTKNIPITMLRLFNTIGPRQTGRYGMVVPRFVQQACLNEPLTVYGDGTQTRSFCDVRDTVVAFDLLAKNNQSIGEIVNVGFDSEIMINDLAELVRKRAESSSDILHVPFKEAYGHEFIDIAQRCPDIAKLKKLTALKHRYNLNQTIDDLISIFRVQSRGKVIF